MLLLAFPTRNINLRFEVAGQTTSIRIYSGEATVDVGVIEEKPFQPNMDARRTGGLDLGSNDLATITTKAGAFAPACVAITCRERYQRAR